MARRLNRRLPRPRRCEAGLRKGLLVALAALAIAGAGGAADRGRDPRVALRRELQTEINLERAARGLPPLELEATLVRRADERAALAERAGGVAEAPLSSAEALVELARRGYEASRVTEMLVQSDGSPEEVVGFWRRQAGAGFAEALSAEYGDLGVGVAVPEDAPPIYAFVFARSAADDFRARTARLADLDAVRAVLLERTHAARRAAGRPPLRADARLERAAQEYAELMLRRGHYGHTGPDGSTALERAAAAGYAGRTVAENLARGQDSPEQAVEAWLASRPHRRNLLDPELSDVGHGLAFGRGPDGRQIYWVQLFGTRAE